MNKWNVNNRRMYSTKERCLLRLTDRGTSCNRKKKIEISIGVSTDIVYADPDPHSFNVT